MCLCEHVCVYPCVCECVSVWLKCAKCTLHRPNVYEALTTDQPMLSSIAWHALYAVHNSTSPESNVHSHTKLLFIIWFASVFKVTKGSYNFQLFNSYNPYNHKWWLNRRLNLELPKSQIQMVFVFFFIRPRTAQLGTIGERMVFVFSSYAQEPHSWAQLENE